MEEHSNESPESWQVMKNSIMFSIDSNGDTRFLVNELSNGFLNCDSTVRRASHVEPVNPFLRVLFTLLRYQFGDTGKVAAFTRNWDCAWRVNLTPVHGPIVPVDFASRQSAIDFEIDWLETNFL
jgi:hypothetical protein